MEIRNIVTFVRATELGSFTRVAQELGYAQSTITTQIKQLESEIGSPLFDRIGKKIHITDIGTEFLQYANEIIQVYNKIEHIGDEKEITGHLRVGVLESLLTSRFHEILPLYHEKYPNVTLEVKTASGQMLLKMLRENLLDIVYILDIKMMEEDCVCAFSTLEPVVFVTNSTNPLALKSKVPLAEILAEPLIMIEKVGLYRKALEAQASKQNLIVSPYLQLDSTTIIINLLRKNMGVSFLPLYVVYEGVRHGTLGIIDADMEPVEFFSQLFYKQRKWVSPAMEVFIAMVSQIYTD